MKNSDHGPTALTHKAGIADLSRDLKSVLLGKNSAVWELRGGRRRGFSEKDPISFEMFNQLESFVLVIQLNRVSHDCGMSG